jgi:hypothetical protein
MAGAGAANHGVWAAAARRPSKRVSAPRLITLGLVATVRGGVRHGLAEGEEACGLEERGGGGSTVRWGIEKEKGKRRCRHPPFRLGYSKKAMIRNC